MTFYVRSIDGNVIVCSCNGELKHLNSQIFAKTGILPAFQQLYFGRKLLTKDTIRNVPNASNINLLIGLMGGHNCEICYEKGEYQCEGCDKKIFCSDCCIRFHKHPDRTTHNPSILCSNQLSSELFSEADDGSCSSCKGDEDLVNSNESVDDDYDISDTPDTSQAFQEASMIMTLAENFNLTRFRGYQKEAILALLSGRDCLISQPTGSGKSMCFKFPAVYENKKTHYPYD